MLINALCNYYDLMAERGDTVPEGYSKIELNYLVALSPDGKITGIIDLGEQDGKKKIYPKTLMPLRTEKPGIDVNFIEHRPLYLFGLACDKVSYTAVDNKAKKSHNAFVTESIKFFDGIESPIAQAYLNFVKNWIAEEECENAYLMQIVKDYNSSKFGFCLSGCIDKTLHGDEIVKKYWEIEYSKRLQGKVPTMGECSIYGEQLPIADIHNSIKGIKGGLATGCKLICVNNLSENSYEKTQGSNSCISEKAMKKYTEALNFLLSSPIHKTFLGDMTIVHFAEHKDDEKIAEFTYEFLFSDGTDISKNNVSTDDLEKGIKENIKKLQAGRILDLSNEAWNSAKYYIFGLLPNSSRIAIKFSWQSTFGELKRNIEKFHEDFIIEGDKRQFALWKIGKELNSPKSSSELPADYMQSYMKAMLDGTQFPVKILQLAIRRVKTDHDEEKNPFIKFNSIRMGIIKACLVRRNRNKEELITMSLNIENKNAAYLCGRLFAVLEKIQYAASGNNLNKTIVDTYFSSTCSTPALVFPRLIKLSQAHLGKLESTVYYEKLIGEIMDKMQEFPKTLALEEQGNFILGYYQQRTAFFTKNTEENINGNN